MNAQAPAYVLDPPRPQGPDGVIGGFEDLLSIDGLELELGTVIVRPPRERRRR